MDGLDGTECNSRDILAKGACTTEPRDAAVCGASTVSGGKPSDPSVVCVTDQALDNCPYDPNHAHGPTTERIFGCRCVALLISSSIPRSPLRMHRSDCRERTRSHLSLSVTFWCLLWIFFCHLSKHERNIRERLVSRF